MGSETNTWSNIKKHLDGVLSIFYQRIEDALSVGIPDLYLAVNGRGGWYELKQLDAFPARMTTPVRLDYRPNQATWAERYARTGGVVGLVTQVGRDYFLHDDIYVMRQISNNELNKDEFAEAAKIITAPSSDFVMTWITYHIERTTDK